MSIIILYILISYMQYRSNDIIYILLLNFMQAQRVKVRWVGLKIWTLKLTSLRLQNQKTWSPTAIIAGLRWTRVPESKMALLVVRRKKDAEKRLALHPKTVIGHRPRKILHRPHPRTWQQCWQNVPVRIWHPRNATLSLSQKNSGPNFTNWARK